MQPGWCDRASCSAYSTDQDKLYHRSVPVIISTDDPRVMIYIHRGANPDGSGEYIELAELEEPILPPWYLTPPLDGRGVELNMDMDVVDRVHTAIGTLQPA